MTLRKAQCMRTLAYRGRQHDSVVDSSTLIEGTCEPEGGVIDVCCSGGAWLEGRGVGVRQTEAGVGRELGGVDIAG